jgi:uncharacterized membrane protein YkoI
MKKYILSLSVMLTIAASSSFANSYPSSEEKAKESFKKEFAGAESAIWKEAGEYYKVNFLFRGYTVEAYFNAAGELEGSIRLLSFNELPLNIISAVNKRFVDADVLDVYELNNSEGTSYRLTLKSDGKKYRIRMDSNGGITEKEKMKS